MAERRLKKWVVYSIYGLALTLVLTTIYFVEKSIFTSNKYDVKYVDETIFDNDVPVIKMETEIIRPYSNDSISIIKDYYDYDDDETNQNNSIIYHENTYLQNSGIDYSNGEAFDALAILKGTVISVNETDLSGYIVQIRHDNDLISIYQSLESVTVKENDIVKQGDIIGKTGSSNIDPDLGNHLHFEIVYHGSNVDPELYFNKKLSDL